VLRWLDGQVGCDLRAESSKGFCVFHNHTLVICDFVFDRGKEDSPLFSAFGDQPILIWGNMHIGTLYQFGHAFQALFLATPREGVDGSSGDRKRAAFPFRSLFVPSPCG
jgi:hypothetical protein